MKKITLTILLCFTIFSVFSQDSFWTLNTQKKDNSVQNNLYLRNSNPSSFKKYNLKLNEVKNVLQNITSKTATQQIIEMPTITGKTEKFTVKEASVLAPELAAKFPMIKSFVGQSINNPSTTVRFSFGTDGLHAVIFSADKETFYIEPYTKNNKEYIAYKKSSLATKKSDFQCLFENNETATIANTINSSFARNANDGKLRTFRLALVCSGEYAQFHLGNQSVSATETDAVKKAAVLSAMNTTMTKVNAVFERDLSVRMEIVANNTSVIYLDAATDGITDGVPNLMINEVQTICDTEIGDANYDIGHVFSVAGDGLAGGSVVCVSGQKAKGVTGRSQPIGDPYDIDYVAHEMGHQFGANHTQNNSCQRNNLTAVEPGSGSTIMGYAGICSPNVQNNSDAYFHAVSITEMWNTIQSSANCGTLTNTNNAAPTANAGLDYSIPKSTPFVLKGIGTDADASDILTYNWEQIDPEIATMAPLPTNTGGPMFRSFPSTTTPDRFFPKLATVIAGNTASTWEVLPSVARELNFSLVVRDNKMGGASAKRDDVKITVTDATAFTVSAPNTPVSWDIGSVQTVTWNKGTTDVTPINCQNVTIKLSVDGGITFPIILAANTSNDGSEDIVIPNNPTATARIMVAAADNVFYNVNNTNFSISIGINNVLVETVSETCINENDGKINVNVALAGYTYQATLTGNNVNLTEQISGLTHSFSNLDPGFYKVCVTVQELNTTHCFEVEIIESNPISLRMNEDNLIENNYNFNVDKGTAPFSIFVNNNLLGVFNSNDFTVAIPESGKISVKTAKDCEGKFRSTLNETVYLSKNPVSENIKLVLPFNLEQTFIETIIADINGKIVFKKKVSKKDNSLLIPFKNYAKGIYILKLSLENSKPIKIIKE